MFQDEEDEYFDLEPLFTEAAVMTPPVQAGAGAAAAAVPQPQLTIKTSVDLPVYSGHPVNQKYMGKDGTSTELYRVQDWLFEIQKIGRAGNWSATTMATQAAMKLVPGSPAANWIKVVEQSGNLAAINEISMWDSFKAAMVREFGAPADFGSLVALLHSFKQGQNELVRDFYNRLVLGYNEFALSMPDSFVGDPWDTEDDTQKQRRLKAATVACNFHLKAFFVAGLKAEIRKEVIKAGPTSVEEILKLAKRIEQAKLQEKPSSQSGQPISTTALNAAVNARLAELGFGPSGGGVAATGARSKEGGNQRKERQGDIVCFYCGGSHLASKCEKRTADRNKGIWRATNRCPETSRAQWDAMSKEDRAKGQRTFGRASSAVGQSETSSSPSSQSQQAAASVIPGLSYSHAAGGPLESAYNAYRRQGN